MRPRRGTRRDVCGDLGAEHGAASRLKVLHPPGTIRRPRNLIKQRRADILRQGIAQRPHGLLHISEVKKLTDKNRIDTVEEVLNVGDKVQVEIKEIDQRGKLSLTPVLEKSDESTEA